MNIRLTHLSELIDIHCSSISVLVLFPFGSLEYAGYGNVRGDAKKS